MQNDNINYSLICMSLADNNIDRYLKYYKTFEILEVMDLYLLKLVAEYKEPERSL